MQRARKSDVCWWRYFNFFGVVDGNGSWAPGFICKDLYPESFYAQVIQIILSIQQRESISFFFFSIHWRWTLFFHFFLFSLKACIHVSHFHYPLITWWTSILFPIEQRHRWTSISTVRDRALWVYTQEWYSWMLKNILFSI